MLNNRTPKGCQPRGNITMAGNVSDDAFAQAVSEMGIVAPEHLEAAKAAQARATKQGVKLSLADSMVLKGLLTPAIRENIEKRLMAQQPNIATPPVLRTVADVGAT